LSYLFLKIGLPLPLKGDYDINERALIAPRTHSGSFRHIHGAADLSLYRRTNVSNSGGNRLALTL